VNWIAQIGGLGGQYINGIPSVDSNGNINISGYFDSSTLTAYNEDNTAFTTTLSHVGNYDVFIIQYSSTGSVNWIARIAGLGLELPITLTTASSGDITVSGIFDSSTLTAYNEDNTAFTTTLSHVGDGYNQFTATYNSTGYMTAFIKP
jgi:hypothetical protein